MRDQIQQIFSGDSGAIRYSTLGSVQLDFEAREALSFKYVLEGEEIYYIDRERFRLKKGEVLLFSKGHKYSAETRSFRFNRGLCVDLDASFLQMARYDVFEEEPLFTLDVESFQMTKISEVPLAIRMQLEAMIDGGEIHSPLGLEGVLNELMDYYLSLELEYTQKVQEIPAKRPIVKQELFARLLTARTYLYDHRFDPILLQDLAKASGLSKYYLQRLFKRTFGETPAKMQERLKMEYAYQHIQLNQDSISEIAYALGFDDLSYFSRRFKQYFGIRPLHLRQQK